MQIRTYSAVTDFPAVAGLWKQVLGEQYPVSNAALYPRVCGRPTYEAGDAFVAVENDRIVGFGMVEVDRTSLSPSRPASVQALLVDPACQRRGTGSALLERLERRLVSAGCASWGLSDGSFRFWSGIPEDLPAAAAFFEKHGYARQQEVIDMLAPTARATPPNEALHAAGARVVPATADTLPSALALLGREAPGWRHSLLFMALAGDLQHALLVRRGEETIGCIQTFVPSSRFRGPNLVWDQLLGEDLGGLGAVLIAEAWRGRGLGLEMYGHALAHIARHGGGNCFIDWTSDGLAAFYGKRGASVWRRFGKYRKEGNNSR
jgi:GNAT superfamily N-acetyltransferase